MTMLDRTPVAKQPQSANPATRPKGRPRKHPAADSLEVRYGLADLAKNKGVTLALTLVLVLSAFLMATGAMVLERLTGSVDRLFEEARPPHFLQMHTGPIDTGALDAFATEHPEIDAWLIDELVGFDGSRLSWTRPATGTAGDLSDSLIDNLFVAQNEGFDLLLDAAGAALKPGVGTVYLPVAFQQRFALEVGDQLTVRTDAGPRTFGVVGFVRDAQMASSLSSATRLLISDADLQALRTAGGGTAESIVEYRLADPSRASLFQSDYDAAPGVPKNGQAVTGDMIRLINVFSDGLVAAALVFVSLLLIAIALLNLRFVIKGTLEDQVHAIGVLKAIGVSNRSIQRLFWVKYAAMTAAACALGGVLAIGAAEALTSGARASYATAPVGPATVLAPLLALAAVFAVVLGICWGVLRGVRRIAVVNALVHGSTLDERQTAARARRRAKAARRRSLASGTGSLNRRLALADLRTDAAQWALIPVVFFLVTVLVTLPLNLLTTFSSPQFVTYMGAPASDLRVDLQFNDDVDEVRGRLLPAMRSDARLSAVRAYANVLYEASGPEGWETLRVEVGDYSGQTVTFLSGAAPASGQIALSVLNADKLGVGVGDAVAVRANGGQQSLVVSGLYQDVTSGGYTAKVAGEVAHGASGYVIYADVPDADPASVTAEYGERFPSATVIPMQAYVTQTLSYVTDAFRTAAVLAFVFGVGVAALITSLFLKLRLTRERRRMGVLSAIGFSTREIVAQVRLKTLLTVALGVGGGLAFAATAGESLVGGLLSLLGLGIASLRFITNPALTYVACPLALVAAGYLASVLLTARLRRADKSTWLAG